MENNGDTISKTISSGFLPVGDGHEIFYEQWGKPDGIDVLFLHGGPGYGCKETDKRFFDPEVFRVLFFDQRGAGNSRPSGGLERNETSDLLTDIDQLLNHFNISKTVIFGGSWGSTLALLYALHAPGRVQSLVLRAFFPGTESCIQELNSEVARAHAPYSYERFITKVPENQRDTAIRYYYQMMCSDDDGVRDSYALEWSRYGFALSRKGVSEEELKLVKSTSYYAHSLLTAHYAVNNCFLPDNFIYNEVKHLPIIPTFLVHGAQDILCPAIYAERLVDLAPFIHFDLVKGGHASSEPQIEERLYDYMRQVKGL